MVTTLLSEVQLATVFRILQEQTFLSFVLCPKGILHSLFHLFRRVLHAIVILWFFLTVAMFTEVLGDII